MLAFCGEESCSIDTNGRIKLPSKFSSDFSEFGEDVVLYLLPEGAIAIYPEETYLQMRSSEPELIKEVPNSLLLRRKLRRRGAMCQSQKISKQRRLTIPKSFRKLAGLEPNIEAVVVGVEFGIEIWNAEKWYEELELIDGYLEEKGTMEMAEDLIRSGEGSK